MTQNSEKYWSGEVAELLRVGKGFALSAVDPDSTPGYADDKDQAAEDLAAGAADLDELQERLYAQSRGEATDASVLLVLQAMDTAGKGGIIRHVVGSVDPQGILLTAFKKPTPRSSRTTSCGASSGACRSRDTSACSTGRTTRTC